MERIYDYKKAEYSSDRCVSVHGLRNDNLDDGHAFQRIAFPENLKKILKRI